MSILIYVPLDRYGNVMLKKILLIFDPFLAASNPLNGAVVDARSLWMKYFAM